MRPRQNRICAPPIQTTLTRIFALGAFTFCFQKLWLVSLYSRLIRSLDLASHRRGNSPGRKKNPVSTRRGRRPPPRKRGKDEEDSRWSEGGGKEPKPRSVAFVPSRIGSRRKKLASGSPVPTFHLRRCSGGRKRQRKRKRKRNRRRRE